MTTISDLVNETKTSMYGYYKEIINILDATINASVTSITLSDSFNTIGKGMVVAIDDELIYIRDSDPGSRTLNPVIRGYLGTTAASHTAGAIVEIGSRFNSFAIKRLLKQEIASWPTEIFREAYVDVPMTESIVGYDLSGFNTSVDDFRFPLQVKMSPATNSNTTANKWITADGWRIERGLPTTTFPSGNAIIFDRGWSRTARVTVAQSFNLTLFNSSTDLETNCGLYASIMDIPAMGAAWRALSSRETKRTFTEAQGEPRKAEEVPPMYQMQAARAMKALRDERLAQEAKKLRDKYPILVLA